MERSARSPSRAVRRFRRRQPQTTRRDGDHCRRQRLKMFITSGMRRRLLHRGGAYRRTGAGGVSLLLIERDRRGFAAPKSQDDGLVGVRYPSSSSTMWVPVDNLIGQVKDSSAHHGELQGAARRHVRPAWLLCQVCLDEAIAGVRERPRLAAH